MDEHAIVRSMLLRVTGGVPATAALAKAVLGWAQPHAEWLVPGHEDELGWDALLAGMENRMPPRRGRRCWSWPMLWRSCWCCLWSTPRCSG